LCAALTAYTLSILLMACVVVDLVMEKVFKEQKDAVVEIMLNSKASVSQKRLLLMKKGLTRGIVDELELLNETGSWSCLTASTCYS
jgi:eukaryotic translation initiation factor 2-alpha kinase 4